MSKSANRRANRNARKIAAAVTLPPGACMPFDPAEAQKFARASVADPRLFDEANFALLATLLNTRMPKRFPGKPRSFTPYPSPQMAYAAVYREPQHDHGPRREGAVRSPATVAEHDFHAFDPTERDSGGEYGYPR